MLFLNILVLIFEVLYYSMFMYFAKGEGKFWKYLLLFSILTIIIGIIGTNNILSYLIFVILSIFGIKYIVKVKTSVFEMLYIFIILLIKILIETPFYFLFIKIFNVYCIGILTGIIKTLVILLFKRKILLLYNYLNKLWVNNNFYVRYIFSILMLIYCILSCIFIIYYYL